MDKEQIKDLNSESLDECEAFVGNITTDWEVDTAGNAYRIGNKAIDNSIDFSEDFQDC
ncbi:hypothetical protein [Methylomonas sp. AM2-LC]|uniref:hypothetical protein n=1 Tax=Methylomonas sp. AM2-LC TaxID=3153301 RepID=UPI003265687C